MQVIGVGLLIDRVTHDRRVVILLAVISVDVPALVLRRRPNVLAVGRIDAMQIVPNKMLQAVQFIFDADGN